MSGELHVHDLVLHFFHQRFSIYLGRHFLQVDYFEGAGDFPVVVET